LGFTALAAVGPAIHWQGHCSVVSAPICIPIFVAHLARNIRMTVLIAIACICPAVVVAISACAFHTILKAATLNVATLSPPRVRSAAKWILHLLAMIAHLLVMITHLLVMVPHLLIMVAHLVVSLAHGLLRSTLEVGSTLFVSTAIAVSIRFALFAGTPRVSVFVAIVQVQAAVVVEIISRAFDSVVKTLPLNLLQFPWRRIPAAAILGAGGRG
jgi:hypothetical protein